MGHFYRERHARPASTTAGDQPGELKTDKASWTDKTKPELVEELERRGLDTAGNKPDLVARLEEDDQ